MITRLSQQDKERMIVLRAKGLTLQAIGDQFGVSRQRVSQINDPDYSAYTREYYQNNRERKREYYQNNRERIRKYYQNNREKINARARNYYQKQKNYIQQLEAKVTQLEETPSHD